MADVDTYLQGLQSEGEVDSAGVFTIDMAAAVEKAARFQLPTPDHYGLMLVACAVNLGASKIEWTGGGHQRGVQIGEAGFSALEMQNMFASFVGGADDSPRAKALRYLAVSLNAAAKLPGMRISGTSCDGNSGAQVVVEAGRMTISPLPAGPCGTRLAFSQSLPLEKAGRQVLRWLVGIFPEADPVHHLLSRNCSYSPLSVRVPGRELTVRLQGEWDSLVALNRHRMARILDPQKVARHQDWERDVPFYGFLGAGPRGGGLALVVDGLLYEHAFECPDSQFRALIWHDHLKRDMSLMSLVTDPSLQLFFDQLSAIYQELDQS